MLEFEFTLWQVMVLILLAVIVINHVFAVAYALFGFVPPRSVTDFWLFWPPRWLIGLGLLFEVYVIGVLFFGFPFFELISRFLPEGAQ